MTATAQAQAQAQKKREPLHRRTEQAVHHSSRMSGDWEGGWIRPVSWAEGRRILHAAQRYDAIHKKKDAVLGPFGPRALQVLDYLLALAANCKGRVWPTLQQIGARLRISKSTVVDALRRLSAADCGPIEWVRRLIPADGMGPRGPRVQQTSNLYRIALPKALLKLIPKRPQDQDEATRKAARVAELRAMDQAASPLNGVFLAAHRARTEQKERAAKP